MVREKNDKEDKDISFGIAMSGGGARAGAHIGVLKVLNKKINIKVMSGSSAGAIVAIVYAAGKLKKLERFIKKMDKDTMKKFLRRSKHSTGLFDSEGIEDFVREIVGDMKLQDLDIPVFVCASDILHGREVYLRRGNAAKIAAASSAIPLVFTPVKIGNRFFMDGGIFNDVPSQILKGKADKVIAVNVGNNTTFSTLKEEYVTPRFKALEEKVISLKNRLYISNNLNTARRVKLMNSFVDFGNKLTEYVKDKTSESKKGNVYYHLARRIAESFSPLDQLSDRGRADYVIRPKLTVFNLDFLKASQTIKTGEEAARDFLKKYKKYNSS